MRTNASHCISYFIFPNCFKIVDKFIIEFNGSVTNNVSHYLKNIVLSRVVYMCVFRMVGVAAAAAAKKLYIYVKCCIEEKHLFAVALGYSVFS